MYQNKLEFANSMIIIAAVFAFIEAGLHMLASIMYILVSTMETNGVLIIIPCINSGLLVLLALLMVLKKNTLIALILLIYYVIRIYLGTDMLLPGYWQLFAITPWSFVVLIFQIWGLYYTYRYNRLIPAAAWEAENIRAYNQSNNPPVYVKETHG